MHQGGGDWTHKNPGTEVWVYDVKTQKRIDRIVLPQQANAILVSQDDAPTLFTLNVMPAMMQTFNALDGKYLGTMSGLSGVPWGDVLGSDGGISARRCTVHTEINAANRPSTRMDGRGRSCGHFRRVRGAQVL